jgi:hypothetical protein
MDETIVKGKMAVAAHFGVSDRTVRRWYKDPSFPRLPGRRFELLQIRAWLDRKDGMTPAPTTGRRVSHQPELPDESGKEFWDKQGKKYQAQLRELELRQRRGELVERKEVEQLFVARIMAVKQGLLGLSRSLPPQMAHCLNEREMEGIINRALRHLLEVFSQPLPKSLGAGGAFGGPELADVTEVDFIGDLKEVPDGDRKL